MQRHSNSGQTMETVIIIMTYNYNKSKQTAEKCSTIMGCVNKLFGLRIHYIFHQFELRSASPAYELTGPIFKKYFRNLFPLSRQLL